MYTISIQHCPEIIKRKIRLINNNAVIIIKNIIILLLERGGDHGYSGLEPKGRSGEDRNGSGNKTRERKVSSNIVRAALDAYLAEDGDSIIITFWARGLCGYRWT
jgi:hypothetical protein